MCCQLPKSSLLGCAVSSQRAAFWDVLDATGTTIINVLAVTGTVFINVLVPTGAAIRDVTDYPYLIII